jgi:hypothetical protein
MSVAWPPTQLDHLCNQAQSDAIRRQSLWASRGRPRSWITCAIRRNQTQSGGNRYGRRAAAHAAGSPVQSGAIRRNQEAIVMGVARPPTQLDGLCNQAQSDAIRRQSLWASRGRPRSWMACAIRCNQTQSIGNQEAIRGAIRGLQRPSEGPSEAHQRRIRGESEAITSVPSRLPSRSRA